MIPTRRLAWLAAIATLVALVAAYAKGALVPLVGVDLVVVIAAALDALTIVGKPRIRAERQAPDIFSVGRPNGVTIELRNLTNRSLRGLVTDDPMTRTTSSGIPARFTLPPRGAVSVRYEITPSSRGVRTFGGVVVRYSSVLGLVARQERTDLPENVDVYPDVHAARPLDLLRRQGRQDARLGSLRVRGGDTEFERLRPYQRGDEARHIDWRASARRDDATVRQFQAESNQNVVFAIDVGRAMRGEQGGLTGVDHALNAALLAADVALRGGDKAGMMAFDDAPRTFLRPTGGRTGGAKLTRAVYDLEAGFAATDYRAAMAFLRSQVRARSLFVVFTNLLEPRSARDLSASLRGLMPRHLPLCVIFKDNDVEKLTLAPARRTTDLYVNAAAAEQLAWREETIVKLRRSGVLVLDANPEDVTPELVKSYLEIKARRLL